MPPSSPSPAPVPEFAPMQTPPPERSYVWTVAIIGAVVVLLLIAGVFYMKWSMLPATEEVASGPEETPAPPSPQSDLPTNINDTSDEALTADMAAIDVQMQALFSDSTSVDESINDKPVAQEY